jgi:hypothetical protein
MKPEYAEVLRWIADGKEVQIRPKNGAWVHPSDLRLMEVVCQNLYDDWADKEPTYEFRLKPEGKWYRVYCSAGGRTCTLDHDEVDTEDGMEQSLHFVRWLTDRIYYE